MITLAELLSILALGGLLVVALGSRVRPDASGRGSSARPPLPERRSRASDGNPYRAVRILPAQGYRPAPAKRRTGDPARSAAGARCAPLGAAALPSALATERARRLLGARYALVHEVPLADLVRFERPGSGTPAEHRELRVRTAPWVIADRSSGRVRLVVAPPFELRGATVAVVEALEAGGVAVWGFERWRCAVAAPDAVDLRNALVRAGLAIDPPAAHA